MPRLSPEAEAFGWAAGVINAGAQARASTADIWAAVRGEAERLGITDLSGGFVAVNEYRSIYAGQRNAATAFGGASDAELFTRAYAPEDINARNLADQALFPEYMVRFDMQVIDQDGNPTIRTVTMKDTWLPDMTVGDVRQAVLESAAGLANDYGITLTGVSLLQPVSV